MNVWVDWVELKRSNNSLWSANYCLYGYLHPARNWLLYIGKAGGSTVRQRLFGDHKYRLFSDIQREYDVVEFRYLVGVMRLDPGRKRTSALLADVESLLIARIKPVGNIKRRHSRISRPGMRVHCIGAWPFKRMSFRDDG